MKKIYIILIAILIVNISKAQYVTIPDPNFAAYLITVIPSAMNGNQMDTTNSEITQLWNLNCYDMGIADLTGVEYLNSLLTIDVRNSYNSPNPNMLVNLPELPDNVLYLNCSDNQLIILPTLPMTLIGLYCDRNQLTSLPDLPPSLKYLRCEYNQLTNLPTLPSTLEELYCSYNNLPVLPILPNGIKKIICCYDQLTSLPILPDSLLELECHGNYITNLPILPNKLTRFCCVYNQLNSLPELPNSLRYFYCFDNQITNMPILPDSLIELNCSSNQINCFPEFPNSLNSLYINDNPFTCLPNYISVMSASTLAYPLCVIGDTINNLSNCDGTGSIANNLLNISYSLFPNPANSYFDVKLENNNNLKTIEIYTAEGVFVKQEQFTGNQTRILTNNLSSGLYVVKIETKLGSQFKKVIVVK